jgi:hypothetical protein
MTGTGLFIVTAFFMDQQEVHLPGSYSALAGALSMSTNLLFVYPAGTSIATLDDSTMQHMLYRPSCCV